MNPMKLTGGNDGPLYRQLMQRLRGEISSGVYPANSRIPSESELCAAYAVSRVTVRKALAELTQEGLLRPVQGKGTFVSAPRIHWSLREADGFQAACRQMGCRPGVRIISARRTEADEQTVKRLALPKGQAWCVEIVRLFLADGLPVLQETSRFAPEQIWLLEERLEGSLTQLLAAHGLQISQTPWEIGLCQAAQEQVELLGVKAGEALLALDRVVCDQRGVPLCVTHRSIRSDRCNLSC